MVHARKSSDLVGNANRCKRYTLVGRSRGRSWTFFVMSVITHVSILEVVYTAPRHTRRYDSGRTQHEAIRSVGHNLSPW